MGGRGHERRREGSGRGSCGSSERAGVAARGTRGRRGRIWVGRWKSPERQPGSSSGHLDVSRDPTQRGKPEAGSGGRRNSALSLLSQEALAPPAPSSGHRPTAGRSEPIGLGRPWRFGRESGAPGWLRTTPASMPFRVGGTLERIHHVAQPLLFQVRTPRSRGRRPFSAPGRKSCACCGGNVSWPRPHTRKSWTWGLNPGFPSWETSKEAGLPRGGIQGMASLSHPTHTPAALLWVLLGFSPPNAAAAPSSAPRGSRW